MKRLTTWRWLAAALGYGVWAGPATAAEAPAPAAQPTTPRDATGAGVYLDDSLEAADELARAERAAAAQRWRQAAQTLLSVANRFGRHLVRLDDGLYVNVGEYVNRKVARWAEPGRRVYRALCEPQARLAADAAIAARSIPRCLEVVHRYFNTTHAVRAADVAAQLAMEAGQFELAAALYARLLRMHPDRATWENELKAKLALCHAWAGRRDEANRLVQEIETAAGPAGHVVEWAGMSQPVGLAVARQLEPSGAAAEVTDGAAFSWPVFGGSVGRTRVIASEAQAGAALWRVGALELAPVESSSNAAAQGVENGRYLGLQLAVGHGMIYVHGPRSVRAIWASNGQEAWPAYQARGLTRSSRSYARTSEPPPLHTTTLAGDRLYVRLGRGPPSSRRGDGESILVCLDALTGEERWRADRTQLGPKFDKTYFDGAPLAHQGKLYVVARTRRSLGFEDCYLLRLDGETGRLEWQTHLTSGSVGGFGYRRATLCAPAMAGHAIYICTNLGTVVSVSLDDGRVRWARLYVQRRAAARNPLWGRSYYAAISPWQFDPVLVWGSRIVCKPLDTDRLLVLDQADGTIRQDLPLDTLHDLQYILGIHENRLYAVGDEVFCYDLAAGKEVWARSKPEGKIYGRGAMTTSALFVPTTAGLYRFGLDGTSPDARQWEGKTDGGNVLVTPHQVLVAGNDHVTAYARKDEALARLRARIDAAPQEPDPHLDLAELAFRVDEIDTGLAALDVAAARAGGYTQIDDEGRQQRVFRNCLHFADMLLARKPPRRQDALALYFKAGQCAPDAASHVLFRRKLAVFYTTTGQYAQAVARWQQILTDRSLRGLIVPDDAGKPGPAGAQAERAIGGLIEQQGREVYARFEDQARSLLAAGRDGGQLDLLARVSTVFPNSQSAAPALLARADVLRQAGRPQEAARVYRHALTHYRDALDAPAAMRLLSDCYREAGKRVTAAAWLARAEREFPKAKVRVGSARLSWQAYRRRVLADAKPREASRPRIVLPLVPAGKRGQRVFGAAVEILEPQDSDLPAMRWDFLAVYSAGKLYGLDPGSGRALWEAPIACRMKPQLRGTTMAAAVFATEFEVFAVDIDTGQVRWRVGDYPAGLGDAARDPEEHRRHAFAATRMFADRVIAARRSGEVICLDPATGRQRWRVTLPQTTLDGVAGSEELIVCRGLIGRAHRFYVLDADGGPPAGEPAGIDLEGDEASIWFDLAPDGTLLVATAQTLHAYEPFTGQRLWSERHGQSNVAASIAMSLDGVYLTQDAQRFVKRDLADGRLLWTSQAIARSTSRPQAFTTTLQGGDLYVRSGRSVVTLDPTDGSIVWEGMTETESSLTHHFLTDEHVVAIDAKAADRRFRNRRRKTLQVFFYERRDRSGLIRSIAELGVFDEFGAAALRDHSLIVQDGRVLYFYPDTTTPPPAGDLPNPVKPSEDDNL